MLSRFLTIIVLLLVLPGCAERTLQIFDKNNKVVGECIAGYDWHFYGLQDSIDYMLYQCAKESIQKGLKVSDESILGKDFTLPNPPQGKKEWNKKLAMFHFRKGDISETKLGYVLAAIEYEFHLTQRAAQTDLAEGKIAQSEFNKIISAAKLKWLGE